MGSQTSGKNKISETATNPISGNTLIADMVKMYPQVVGYLVAEYGFHCVSCFISGFEVLEDGARVHGITGDDFEVMLTEVNKIARGEITDEWES